jgi:putative ABC transport system permease protein
MSKLAIKNLLQERLRLFVSVGGVAAAIVLVLVLEGVFAGSSEQLVAYIERSDADVWVMQEGVSNMHMATSVLPRTLQAPLASLPEVADAVPILYASNLIEVGGKQSFSYIVGIPPGAERGGPWAMRVGVAIPGPGEVVLPEVMVRAEGLTIGDQVTILDRPFTVVGLSEGTFSLANSVTFVAYEDMEDILAMPGTASYFLVRGAEGIAPQDLSAAVQSALPGVHAMLREELADNDRVMVNQMGVDVIRVMSFIGFAVGVLVVGLTVYTATVRRIREYGVVKALGANNGQLLRLVLIQTVAIALLSFGAAVALAYLLIPVLGYLAPEVPLLYPAGSLATWGAAIMLVALLAALLPAYRIAQVEPAVVFKE